MMSAQKIFWRKHLILRRGALEVQWRLLFPVHDFQSARLIQPSAKLAVPFGWDEHWSAAAREYAEERRRTCET